MIVLGVSAYTHDTSAALIVDGKLVGFVEEERMNRKKHTTDFPFLAIQKCLDMHKISLSDVDVVSFSQVPFEEIWGNLFHFFRYFPRTLNLLSQKSKKDLNLSIFSKSLSQLNLKNQFKKKFKVSQLPVFQYFPHHLSHNASSFFCSPFSKSALLSIDGRGESETTMIGYGDEENIQVLQTISVPHSLGHLYASITDYLGFKPFHDEWKVMGLSAYGSDRFVCDFMDLISLQDQGRFELNLKYFQYHIYGQKRWLSEEFYRKFGKPRAKSESLTAHHQDVAFALQAVIEIAGVHLANYAYQVTHSENLCLSGGVALNCLMNSKILEQTPFKKLFIQPIANDAGASIGAAWLAYYQRKSRESVLPSRFDIYLGPRFLDSEVESLVKNRQLSYYKSDQIEKDAAKFLAEGKIVAWFQGAMEAGPRALGNRSILANPNRAEMKEKINRIVKKRENFRPFAPSVLEEEAEKYFQIPKSQNSPYMVLTAKVQDSQMECLPAITHVDGTARVQTVSRQQNPKYYRLIEEFGKLTGVPVLLNTSFNENEPIVCTPDEALDCFLRTEIDYLVLHDFIITKSISFQ